VISARELLEGDPQDASYDGFHTRSRLPNRLGGERGDGWDGLGRADTPLVWAREGTTPLSDRDLRAWYQQRIRELTEWGRTASGEADWEAVRRRHPGRVTRARLRGLRKELAPADWKKQGRRSPVVTG
jgi:hypothetical protein